MSDEANKMLEAAINYVKKGWSVIPLHGRLSDGKCTCSRPACEHPGKHPRLPWKEFQKRLPAIDEIKTWWKKWPDANIGIVCGAVSGGLAVLDIDDIKLASQVLATDLKTITMMVKTPGQGAHAFYREVNPSAISGPLKPGVADLKAEGGYVVAPPSIGYELISDKEPLLVSKLYAQMSLVLGFDVKPKSETTPPPSKTEESLVAQESIIIEGERNHRLASIAGTLRRNGVDAETLSTVLEHINNRLCDPPLSASEVLAIARSIGRYPAHHKYDLAAPIDKVVAEPKWISAKALSEQDIPDVACILKGFLGPGLITLLSARPKIGKTTLLFHFLKSFLQNLAFLGIPTLREGKILLLSEEPPTLFRRRIDRLGLKSEDFLLLSRFSVKDWPDALDQARSAIELQNVSLLVVDTLSAFWNITDENDAPNTIKALQPLQALAHEKNIAVLLIHHLRKMGGDDGAGHRGSSALPGAVDIAFELYKSGDTRRTLKSMSRFEETPTSIIIELKDDVYTSLGSSDELQYSEVRQKVLDCLPDPSDEPINRNAIAEQLDPKPSMSLLKEILAELVREEKIEQHGKGAKGSPYLYRKKTDETNLGENK